MKWFDDSDLEAMENLVKGRGKDKKPRKKRGHSKEEMVEHLTKVGHNPKEAAEKVKKYHKYVEEKYPEASKKQKAEIIATLTESGYKQK